MTDAIAEGLWRRVRDAALAERRLQEFAFTEAPAAPAPALAADEPALAALARDVTLRAFSAAADATGYRVLARLAGGALTVEALAHATALPALAVTERLGALAQVGLASRALERDEAEATAAGRALVALIDEVAAGVTARCRAGLAERP